LKWNNRYKRVKSRFFSSKRVFLILFFIFLVVALIRFMAIKHLNTTSKENYIYNFKGNIFASFYIKNDQTFLEQSIGDDIRLYPYSFITLRLDGKKLIYQLIPDEKEKSLSIFTRIKWFEVIGGNYKNINGDTLVRLHRNDTPSLIILNTNRKKSLYRAKSLDVIALKEGYFYWKPDGTRVPIPVYDGSLDRIRVSTVWKNLESVTLDKNGYISDGKNIIKITLGTKNRSVIVSKNPKRYNLVKAKTINIAVVNQNTPASTLKLVYADPNLYKERLTYNYVRIAHLLIKYGIKDASSSIVYAPFILKDELKSLVEEIDSFKKANFYKEYLENRRRLTKAQKIAIDRELFEAVVNGDYYKSKTLIGMGANVNILDNKNRTLLDIVLSHKKNYLVVPSILEFVDNRLVIRGNSNVFKNSTYSKGYFFPTKAPILDKPKIPENFYLNVNEIDKFVDVLNLNGLYVSDKDAKVYYSKDGKTYKEAFVNYTKAPPLFLYNSEIKGKFVAPNINIRGRFYYKIVTKKKKVKVAFNGVIRRGGKIVNRSYNQIIPFYDTYTLYSQRGKIDLEVFLEDRPLPCGIIFSSKKKVENFRYSYDGKHFFKFIVYNRGDKYYYQLDNSHFRPFRDYFLFVKADKGRKVRFLGNSKEYIVGRKINKVGYSPSLSCLAKNKDIELSLYDKDNIMEIVPKPYTKLGMVPKDKAKLISNELNLTQIDSRLLPIVGDGASFGVTAKEDVKLEDLTLDVNFSKKIADIFEKVIKPLNSKHQRAKREKYNTILEGGVIVLADRGDKNLQIVGMFSYPYPKDLNLSKPTEYKREIFKYMLLDKFNNKESVLRNRTFDMRIRPGSTFKTVTSIAGFKTGMINKLDRDYRWYIEGKTDLYGSYFRNNTFVMVHLKNFSFANGMTEKTENATFKNSFKMSYNVYFGYLALLLNHKLDRGYKKSLYPISSRLEDRRREFSLVGVADDLGFNKKLVISKSKNIIAPPSLFPKYFGLSKEVADSGIGQFEVAATPLQMAIVANTIRTRDVEIPKLLKEDNSTTVFKNYIKRTTQLRIGEAMGLVVSDPDGTAKCAFYPETFRALCYKYNLSFKGVNPKDFSLDDVKVYGKTGTAEKGKGKLYDGWFIAFAQSKTKGDIVVATVVRNSGTGGTYSATITKKVIEAWYNRDNNSSSTKIKNNKKLQTQQTKRK